MRVVLDTNVLVAAFRSREGASFELLVRLRGGRLEAVVSVALILEYEEVLLKHRAELGLTALEVGVVIDALARLCVHAVVSFLGRPRLSDPDDEHVLEAALAGGAAVIVTHNTKHFAAAGRSGVRVMTPGQFLREDRG